MARNIWPEAGAVNSPLVTLIACMSIDGYIARYPDEVPNQVKHGGWTSPEDKEIFKTEVVKSDILLMGRRTYETIPKSKKTTMVVTNSTDLGKGVGVIIPTRAALVHWLDYEADSGVSNVLLCGGAMTYAALLEWDLVDRMILVMEPFVFGRGVRLCQPEDGTFGETLGFRLTSGSRLNKLGTLCLRYERE